MRKFAANYLVSDAGVFQKTELFLLEKMVL